MDYKPNFTAPWASMIPFKYAGRVSILDVDDFQPGKIVAKVDTLPTETVKRLNFVMTSTDGQKRNMLLPIKPDSSKWKAGEKIEITFPVPRWAGKSFKLGVEDEFIFLKGAKNTVDVAAVKYPRIKIQQACLLNTGKRPLLEFGGKKYNPIYFNIGRSQGQGKWHEIQFAVNSGMKNFRFGANMANFWKGENRYDFSNFDSRMDDNKCPLR